MSYEPRILIRTSDLEKNRKKIESIEHSNPLKNLKKQAAYNALLRALRIEPVVFPELSITVISPELSEHNAAVRNLLDELSIDYRIEY